MELTDEQVMCKLIELECELKDTFQELNKFIKEATSIQEDSPSILSFIKKIHELGLMSNAEAYIQKKFNLSSDKARGYIIQFIDNYPYLTVEKKPEQKKPSSKSLQVWNSFLKVVRSEMEEDDSKVSYEDVVKKAREMKDSDQDSYKLFAESWTPDS